MFVTVKSFQPSEMQHFNLMGSFISYEENKDQDHPLKIYKKFKFLSLFFLKFTVLNESKRCFTKVKGFSRHLAVLNSSLRYYATSHEHKRNYFRKLLFNFDQFRT